ncbi:4Fe-4S binding protein [Desulfovibrio inopinatus]|uniref:4Fe-4S binding protein n=1 Tax=Desulfovibrio inopinatus TaxID=102109 RepID=UPI00041A2A8D|nr:4Fe-4S binding protein [Desulfovibrio inopinatus]
MKKRLTPPRFQRLIQGLFFLLSLFIGWRFVLFCQWILSSNASFVARPAGVEGFLPISALLGFKYFLTTGLYDPVHPAGLTIFLIALGSALLFRKGFCGYICPAGLVSNLLASVGQRIGLGWLAAGRINAVLCFLKYLLLAFFIIALGFGMSGPVLQQFLFSPYNMTADARMLLFFQHPSVITLCVLGVLIILSLTLRNPWCRWLCPYGALLGLLAWIGPTAIHRQEDTCTNCKQCQRACPSAIPVYRKTRVRTPECIGCAQCIHACPEPETLHMHCAGRSIPWRSIGVGVLSLFLFAWLTALTTDNWNSRLPLSMLKAQYAKALSVSKTDSAAFFDRNQ